MRMNLWEKTWKCVKMDKNVKKNPWKSAEWGTKNLNSGLYLKILKPAKSLLRFYHWQIEQYSKMMDKNNALIWGSIHAQTTPVDNSITLKFKKDLLPLEMVTYHHIDMLCLPKWIVVKIKNAIFNITIKWSSSMISGFEIIFLYHLKKLPSALRIVFL